MRKRSEGLQYFGNLQQGELAAVNELQIQAPLLLVLNLVLIVTKISATGFLIRYPFSIYKVTFTT